MSKRVQTVGMLLALTSMAIGGSSTAYAGTVTASNAAQNMQQNAACKGVVKDATGEPIIGVSVIVKGTTNGAVTDIDGNFSLANVKKGATLRFTYLGYNPQEVVYNGQPLNITLVEDSKALDEVVVTALGIKKDAKKLGYAVSTVSSADLTKTGSSNIAAGLYGKATGVRIQSAPGGGTSAVSISALIPQLFQ